MIQNVNIFVQCFCLSILKLIFLSLKTVFFFFLSDEVDLLNVSFDGPNAPDRISAKAGIKELKKIAPLRRFLTLDTFYKCTLFFVFNFAANVLGNFRWKLVEIDADLPKLTLETKRVMSLINPADTYMVNFKSLEKYFITFFQT